MLQKLFFACIIFSFIPNSSTISQNYVLVLKNKANGEIRVYKKLDNIKIESIYGISGIMNPFLNNDSSIFVDGKPMPLNDIESLQFFYQLQYSGIIGLILGIPSGVVGLYGCIVDLGISMFIYLLGYEPNSTIKNSYFLYGSLLILGAILIPVSINYLVKFHKNHFTKDDWNFLILDQQSASNLERKYRQP